MGFGKTELCMLAVIVVCALYLFLSEDQGSFQTPAIEDDIFENFANASEEESVVHRVRGKSADGCGDFVLDLTYSEIPAVLVDVGEANATETANKILDALFSQCTCGKENEGACYQWTLIIGEIHYAKTLGRQPCRGTSGKECLSSMPGPSQKKDATVAKVYVQYRAALESFDCILDTVGCALRHVLPDIVIKTRVQTVLANRPQMVTSSCNTCSTGRSSSCF